MATANEGSKSITPKHKRLSSTPNLPSQQPTSALSQCKFVENFEISTYSTTNHSLDYVTTSLPSHVTHNLVPKKVVDGSSPETISVSSSSIEEIQSPSGSGSLPSQPMSPIVQLLQTQELAKAILSFVVPITILLQGSTKGSFLSNLISISLCVGLAGLWNGILLRSFSPKIANALEQLGVAFIFLAYFGLIGSFLPPSIVWVCWVCFALSLLPFFLSHVPTRESLLPVTGSDIRSQEQLQPIFKL